MSESTYTHPRDIDALLHSLVPVVCPPEVARLGLANRVVEHAALTMGSQSTAIRRAFTVGIRTYDAAAIPRYLRPARKLDPERAERYLLTWWRSPLPLFRTLATSLKGMLCLAYYETPEAHERLGYTPTQWVETVKRRRLSVYSAEIQAHERALLAPDPLPRGHFDCKSDVVRNAS